MLNVARRHGEPLRNPRHEIAALEYANGATEFDAYVKAGFAPDRGNASRFFTANDNVRQRVREIQEQAALLAVDLHRVTKEMVVGGLLELALTATSCHVRVNAWKLIGRIPSVGLFVSDDSNASNDTPQSAPELARAIAGDHDEMYQMILDTIPLTPSEKRQLG